MGKTILHGAVALAICAGLASCSSTPTIGDDDPDPPTGEPPVDVHVIALQSNAVGGAAVEDLPPELAYLAEPYPAVRQSYRIHCPKDGIDGACLEVGWGDLAPRPRGSELAMGIELSLGRRLDERFDAPQVIVKVATSATALGEQWEPDAAPGKWQWQYLVEYLDARMQELPEGSRVAGLYLVGCEGDAHSLYTARAVDEALAYFVMRFRQEYGEAVPVVVAEITAAALPYAAVVSARQWAAAAHVPGLAVAATGDLTFRDARVHYDAASFAKLGQRMADLVPRN